MFYFTLECYCYSYTLPTLYRHDHCTAVFLKKKLSIEMRQVIINVCVMCRHCALYVKIFLNFWTKQYRIVGCTLIKCFFFSLFFLTCSPFRHVFFYHHNSTHPCFTTASCILDNDDDCYNDSDDPVTAKQLTSHHHYYCRPAVIISSLWISLRGK